MNKIHSKQHTNLNANLTKAEKMEYYYLITPQKVHSCDPKLKTDKIYVICDR